MVLDSQSSQNCLGLHFEEFLRPQKRTWSYYNLFENRRFWALRAPKLFRMTFPGVSEASKNGHVLITCCLKIEVLGSQWFRESIWRVWDASENVNFQYVLLYF